MGQLQFQIDAPDLLPDDALQRIYMSGMEGIPWQGKARLDGNLLIYDRPVNDSGNVSIPWPSTDGGERQLATASLMERPRPYLLEVELARGVLHVIRQQVNAWDLAGLPLREALADDMRTATAQLAKAVTQQHEPANAVQWAAEALQTSETLHQRFATQYAEQGIAARRNGSGPLTALFGTNLGSRELTPTAAAAAAEFSNVVQVPLTWRNVEAQEGQPDWSLIDGQLTWATRQGLRVVGGPLIQFDAAGVPDWAFLFEGDHDYLSEQWMRHVAATVERLRGRVQIWVVAARVNAETPLSLGDQQRMQIVAAAIQRVRELDPQTPIVVGITQPWGEYMVQRDDGFAPFHYADALIRSQLGVSGLSLEINAGYAPGGSLCYTPLEYSRLIDRWSNLGLPLMIQLTTPSQAVDAASHQSLPLAGNDPEQLSEASQSNWIERYVPLLLAKGGVQLILWNQLQDGQAHEFPYGGLVSEEGTPKPAVDALAGIRRRYW